MYMLTIFATFLMSVKYLRSKNNNNKIQLFMFYFGKIGVNAKQVNTYTLIVFLCVVIIY